MTDDRSRALAGAVIQNDKGRDMRPTLQIITPPRAEDALSDLLRLLNKKISEANPELDFNYGLGGSFGYSLDFENDVFVTREFDENYNCDCGGDDRQQKWLDAHPEPRDESAFNAFDAFCETPEGSHTPACATVLPNFRHKSSGFEVRWHKWIGRSMELTNEPPDVAAVIEDCLRSLVQKD